MPGAHGPGCLGGTHGSLLRCMETPTAHREVGQRGVLLPEGTLCNLHTVPSERGDNWQGCVCYQR